MDFPRVPWIGEWKNSSPFDLYVVNIKGDKEGIKFVDEANSLLAEKGITSKAFILFELFCSKYLSDVSDEFIETLKNIENELKEYQWIGLTQNFNFLTRDIFISDIKQQMILFNYSEIMNKYNWDILRVDYDIIYNNFVNNNYNVLFSDNDFSGSFITSEWLFKNNDKESNLEKTFIITGYIKSVEQIITYLIKKKAIDGDKIGINSSKGIIQVDILSQDFYKATLGNLEHYLSDYNNLYLYDGRINRSTIYRINNAIKEWIKTERNGFFHKDNISSLEKVNEIREKTFVLYFYLLGTIVL